MKYASKKLYAVIVLISLPALSYAEPGEAAFNFMMIYRLSQIIMAFGVFAGMFTIMRKKGSEVLEKDSQL